MISMELLAASISLVLVIVTLLFILVVITESHPPNITLPGEDKFYCSILGRSEVFPSIDEDPSIELSVIIPAYNEELRLPKMLEECLGYLESRTYSYEVIVVDDCSKDATSKVALGFGKQLGSSKFRVLTLCRNRGKGGAVKMGVLRARGKKILYADADGATRFADLEKLEKESAEIICGSRSHLEQESISKRSAFRTILMKGFHFCVWLFGSSRVQDTQCGFKLIQRHAAKRLFKNLHIERWAFDVELLKMAELLDFSISEVAVNWQEISGSKLEPISASLQMLRDLFLLWLRYKLGLWNVKNL